MKYLFMAICLTVLFSCGNGSQKPIIDTEAPTDSVPPPPDKPRDSVPVADTILPPPPPPVVEDTIVPPPVDVPQPPTVPVSNNYTLVPGDYDLVQGKVTDAQALKNRFALEKAFADAVEKKVDTFKIGRFDAYFDVHTVTSGTTNRNFYPWVEAVNVPANFNLQMSDDTFLRVQPNNSPKSSLLYLFFADNTSVRGGKLEGERLTHTYSGSGSDEWGHLLNISSSQNVLIENVTMFHANGDGLVIHAREHYYKENHVPSKNVTIRKNRFLFNRRQGISITSGEDLLIDGNYFEGTGRDIPGSNGTNPRMAIDVEPGRARDKKTNALIEYEHVERVTIINNTEVNSAKGGLIIKAGSFIDVVQNHFNTGITYNHADHVVVKDNILENEGVEGRVGVSGGSTSEFCFANSILYNNIKGYTQAIKLYGGGNTVTGNTSTGFKVGLTVADGRDSKIENNRFVSDLTASYGLFLHTTNLDNVLFHGNHFESDRGAAVFTFVNRNDGQEGFTFKFQNNTLVSSGAIAINGANGVEIAKNTVRSGFEIGNSHHVKIEDNQINSGNRDGIQLREGNKTISITGNQIATNRDCMEIRETPLEFIERGNVCN